MTEEKAMVVQIPEWNEVPWLRHGFSTRRGGVSRVYQKGAGPEDGELNLGWTASDPAENVTENRRRFVLGVAGKEFAAESLITVRQVHGVESRVVSAATDAFFAPDGRAALEADGLMTNLPGRLLGIQTADCVPVLVVDIARRAVAAFHAGWRGTVAGIVEKGVAQMRAAYGSRPEDMAAAIGPSIGACCYSVGEEVRAAFEARFSYASELFTQRGQETFLDLWEANRRQLLDAGVGVERISVVGECSGCMGVPGGRKYFSHRCEQGFTGRMMSLVGIEGKDEMWRDDAS